MRNRYPGPCYRCGEWVAAGEGHFERHQGGWRVQHASCAIKHRGTAVRAAPKPRRSRYGATIRLDDGSAVHLTLSKPPTPELLERAKAEAQRARDGMFGEGKGNG